MGTCDICKLPKEQDTETPESIHLECSDPSWEWLPMTQELLDGLIAEANQLRSQRAN